MAHQESTLRLIISQSAELLLYYSTDGINWNNLLTAVSPPIGIYPPDMPTGYALGPYFSGAAGTATTGVHIGNIVAQDISPASPNCRDFLRRLSRAVASRRCCFYETISGNTSVYPALF